MKPMEGKCIISETGEWFFKGKIKCQYLAEPATKMFLPVVIRWTLRNKNPVSPTGERGDKGQVSEMRGRSVTLGATLHRLPNPYLAGLPVPLGGEMCEDLCFHAWGEGKSAAETASQ